MGRLGGFSRLLRVLDEKRDANIPTLSVDTRVTMKQLGNQDLKIDKQQRSQNGQVTEISNPSRENACDHDEKKKDTESRETKASF